MGKQERNPQKCKCIFITYNQDKVANTDMSISHVTKVVVIKINVHFKKLNSRSPIQYVITVTHVFLWVLTDNIDIPTTG